MDSSKQPKRQNQKPKYHHNQSPLFKLRSHKKLAKLLEISLPNLKKLIEYSDANYFHFPKQVGKKIRNIAKPKPRLEKLHGRLRLLLSRICPPDYLYSSTKKRGYRANAQQHLGIRPVFKIDIKDFYPSTNFRHVYHFFVQKMKCSKDISHTIAILTTYQNQVPVGSPVSDLLAFFANKSLFDRLANLASENNLIFTAYVDDICMSGAVISRELQFKIKKIIYNWGFQYHKNKFYEKNQAKDITGIILKGNQTKLPNCRHLQMHKARENLSIEKNLFEKQKIFRTYIGRVREAESIDSKVKEKNYLAVL